MSYIVVTVCVSAKPPLGKDVSLATLLGMSSPFYLITICWSLHRHCECRHWFSLNLKNRCIEILCDLRKEYNLVRRALIVFVNDSWVRVACLSPVLQSLINVKSMCDASQASMTYFSKTSVNNTGVTSFPEAFLPSSSHPTFFSLWSLLQHHIMTLFGTWQWCAAA